MVCGYGHSEWVVLLSTLEVEKFLNEKWKPGRLGHKLNLALSEPG